jgi:TetR/AcrR family transcriptional repressor of nem operon
MFGALGTEAARCNDETRQVMTEAVRKQIDRFSTSAPGETAQERRKAAMARWSAMVGAVILARAVDDPALSDELLSATLEAVEG